MIDCSAVAAGAFGGIVEIVLALARHIHSTSGSIFGYWEHYDKALYQSR